MKVICATGCPEIDEMVRSLGKEVAGIAYTRENVLALAQETRPDVAVLNLFLPGPGDILDLILQMRSLDIRIVLLAGDADPQDMDLHRAVEMGVYDIIFDPVRPGDLAEKVERPTPYSAVLQALGAPVPSGGPEAGRAEAPAPEEPEEERKPGTVKVLARAASAALSAAPRPQVRSGRRDRLPNLVAVWSPVSAGRTFTAVNLAAALADAGEETALVDLDPRLAVAAWLYAPPGEDGLISACGEGDPASSAYQPKGVRRLLVYAADPLAEGVKLPAPGKLERLVRALCRDSSRVVADLPSDTALARPWLDCAGRVVLVCDQDFARLARVQAELEALGEAVDDRWVLAVNRYSEAAGIPPSVIERAAGMRALAVFPDCSEDVLPALKKGVPASLFSAGLRPGFRDLALALKNAKGVAAFG